MKGRNLKLNEKKAVKKAQPNLNVNNWLLVKKFPDRFILKHRETDRERTVRL
ncbi:MAG: hypothetical protein IJX07_06165 [Bacillales bacterium]|nr:hypothetical protein [Bacillales bacterium]